MYGYGDSPSNRFPWKVHTDSFRTKNYPLNILSSGNHLIGIVHILADGDSRPDVLHCHDGKGDCQDALYG